MRIKMKSTMAGPEGVVSEGALIERDDVTAQELIDGGYAEAVGAIPAASAASAPDEERDAGDAEDGERDAGDAEDASLTPPETATTAPTRARRK